MRKVKKAYAAKILIFYRDLPEILLSLIRSDGHTTIVKDGSKPFENQKAPRITVTLNDNGELFQDKRIAGFTKTLETLLSNNQIVGFKILS